MLLKLGHFAKWKRNTWKHLKCGAGKECRRSVGPIVREIEKFYKDSKRRGTSYIQ
jgi:hypothetical protein